MRRVISMRGHSEMEAGELLTVPGLCLCGLDTRMFNLGRPGCGLQCLHEFCPLFLSLMLYSFLCVFLSAGEWDSETAPCVITASQTSRQIKFQLRFRSVRQSDSQKGILNVSGMEKSPLPACNCVRLRDKTKHWQTVGRRGKFRFHSEPEIITQY